LISRYLPRSSPVWCPSGPTSVNEYVPRTYARSPRPSISIGVSVKSAMGGNAASQARIAGRPSVMPPLGGINRASSLNSSAVAESWRARWCATKLSVDARIDTRSASLRSGGATLQAANTTIRQGTMARISAPFFPDHGPNVLRHLSTDLLGVGELHFVFAPPLRRHVRAEVGRRHQLEHAAGVTERI